MPQYLEGIELTRTLGAGAQAKVKLGRNPKTGETVAVKLFKDRGEMDAEIKHIIGLEHQNIVNIKGAGRASLMHSNGRSEDKDYIIQELALGGELFDFIKQKTIMKIVIINL